MQIKEVGEMADEELLGVEKVPVKGIRICFDTTQNERGMQDPQSWIRLCFPKWTAPGNAASNKIGYRIMRAIFKNLFYS